MRTYIIIALLVVSTAACVPQSPGFGSGNLRTTAVSGPNRGQPAAPELKRLPNGHYRVKKPWNVKLNGRLWQVQRGYTSNGITGPEKGQGFHR